MFIAKFDKNGKHLWSKQAGDSSYHQYGWRIRTDTKYNVIVAGYFYGSLNFGGGNLTSAGGYDVYVARYDAAGKHLWSARGGDNANHQYGYAVAVDSRDVTLASGYFVGQLNLGGKNLSSAGSNEVFLVSMSP